MGPSTKAPRETDFSGTWVLVPELSGRPATLPGIDKADDKLLARLRSGRLHIEQASGVTRIRYDDQFEQTCRWGKREDSMLQCGWDDGDFLMLRMIPDVGELSRKFILTDEGQSLTVVMVLKREAVTLFYRRDQPRI